MTDFMIHLETLQQEADVVLLTNNDIMLYRYFSGCTNHELRQKLMEMKEPTRKSVEEFVRNWEIAKSQDKALKGKNDSASAKKTTAQNSKGKKKNSQGGAGASSNNQGPKKVCNRCGMNNHLAPDCKLPKDTECNFCKGKGHLERVCKKKQGGASVNSASGGNMKALPSPAAQASAVATDQPATGASFFRVARLTSRPSRPARPE